LPESPAIGEEFFLFVLCVVKSHAWVKASRSAMR
jgi:hypothetical protein